jgi:cytochrome P450
LEGASDTTATMTIAFLQAMVKYQNVQQEVQKEIDSVVGEDRSPIWSDYDDLPYVSMIVKETMRWRPVLPSAFPHAVNKG